MRPVTTLILTAVLALSTSNTFAKEGHKKKRHHKAHTHGIGSLNIVIDQSEIHAEFEIPAESIVGFEYAPKSKAEKKAVSDAKSFWTRENNVFHLSKAARCSPKSSQVNFEFEKKKGHDHHQESHSELHANYSFKCDSLKELDSIEFLPLRKLKGIHKIKGQLATHRKQGPITLTKKNPVLRDISI